MSTMSLNHEARLEKLLSRHRDAELTEGPNGTTALHRRDEILVPIHQADRAHLAADQWTERREDLFEIGVTRLHLRPEARVNVGELATDLRGHSDGALTVSLNHLMRGEPDYPGGPWNVPVPCASLPKPSTSGTVGRRVVAAVLDTGVVAHPWFEGTDWFAQVTPEQIDPIPVGADYALETETGHGTFVTGVLMEKAPSTFIMVERVLDDDGTCDELQLLHGLARLRSRVNATGECLDVINMSLGGYTFDDEPSPLISDALARFGTQTVIVVAAGNHGSSRPFWPAALKSCVSVAALETDGERRAEFSNHGWWVDACAVGSAVKGPFVTDVTPGGLDFAGYAEWSGTSFAAPRVAGAIAALAASKQFTATEAADYLLDTATRTRHENFGVVVE
jgi:subtilisin family serine protease